MIVFKTFLKILKKCKAPIILYTVILVLFSGLNMQNENNSTNFVASKPDVFIINNDENQGITKNLIEYFDKNSNMIDIKNEEDAINDALFYRDVNYIIYIPNHFREDFLNHQNPKIEIKTTGDYQSSLAQMMLERYMKVATIYSEIANTEEELIHYINTTLSNEIEVEITSPLDTSSLEKATSYYNFTNYCLLAGAIYVICLILSSFKDEKIRKRTIISSMNYKEYNRKLLLSNGLFALFLWIFYVVLSFILLGHVMFTMHGVLYIMNSFLFMLCALTIAFLLGNLVSNKNAINGIVNVVALGSSFLCGAFVPMEWLPDFVLKVAHILPSYWYIKTNELTKEIETFQLESLKPVITNMFILLLFSLLFVMLTNVISKKKQKINE